MANRGFEVEVIENYQNALNCVICSLIINKATHGCERHVFCEGCIQEYLTKSCHNGIPVCPGGCRKEINPKKLSPNLAFDMMINKLKSKCSFKNCSWTGDLLDLVKDHSSQCSYATIKCSRNGCRESFLKEDTEKHDNICLYKYLPCCYCENDVLRMNKNDHEKSCAMEKVNCIYQEVGCNTVMCRRDVDKHEYDYQSLHMKLSFQNLKINEKRLTQENLHMKFQLSQLTAEVNKLKEENNVLKQKVFKTCKEVASKEEIMELNKNVSKTSAQVHHLKENIKRKTWSEIENVKEQMKDLIPLQYDLNESRIVIKISAIRNQSQRPSYHQQMHYQRDIMVQPNLQYKLDNSLDKLVKKPNYYENVGNLLPILNPHGIHEVAKLNPQAHLNLDFLKIIPYHWFDFTDGRQSTPTVWNVRNVVQQAPMYNFIDMYSTNPQIQHMITFPVNNNNIEDFMCQYEYQHCNFTIQSNNNTIQISGFQNYSYKFKVAIDGKEREINANVGLKLFDTQALITRKTFCSGCVIIYTI